MDRDMTDKPSGSFVLWENTLCNPLADPRSMAHSAWHDGYASGVKEERHRIYEMLIKMHTQEERHNYYLFIANIIKEST